MTTARTALGRQSPRYDDDEDNDISGVEDAEGKVVCQLVIALPDGRVETVDYTAGLWLKYPMRVHLCIQNYLSKDTRQLLSQTSIFFKGGIYKLCADWTEGLVLSLGQEVQDDRGQA